MRLYTATNWMLRTIQQGIQPLHVVGDMAIKYGTMGGSLPAMVFEAWARNHKTAISLNGGTYGQLLRDYEVIKRAAEALQLPYSAFHEDEESLGGLMTSWGVVVSTPIVDRIQARVSKDRGPGWFTSDESNVWFPTDESKVAVDDLVTLLTSKQLAN
jgi:hypothetical protein